ncbi:hypothetical protein QLL95_gp0418 [Cotonvirus japonicus]|uniref:Uncharacterized protein n=1 Tax=Cotonvirus japonicus TaxID=2811091 RepID=A0ABM7NU60_9VIRU|nr:hypothetical protein QLL95_gp0418 [Cotonvirus japonicus]BCS83705.1 hypothetical protein [Cotonvirus japonicus]
MKYIKNNHLDLGTKESIISKNLISVIGYIYDNFSLNYKKMEKLYENVEMDDDQNGPNPMTDDKYIYKFKYNYDFMNGNEDTYNKKLLKELNEYLTNESPKKLKLEGIVKLTLMNDCGVNEDDRGTQPLDSKLHFWPEYVIYNDKNITFHDLIIASYKIKSHKFENWYEMYCSRLNEFYVLKNSDGKKINKEILAVVAFDHGS